MALLKEKHFMSNTEKYYENLPFFSEFLQVFNNDNYYSVPSDWLIIVTDIKGSTKAIEKGNYRSVNIVGAASIVSVINAVAPIDIPFVFGGDGATILIPPTSLAKAVTALKQWRQKSLQDFQLELRVGIIPVSKVYQQDKNLFVAKYEVSVGNTLAMLKGDGFSLAEKWLKSDSTEWSLENYSSTNEVLNLQGLSCRWNPIQSKNGNILSIIIKPNDAAFKNDEQKNLFLQDMLSTIHQIIGADFKQVNPAKITKSNLSWFSWKSIRNDFKIQKNTIAQRRPILNFFMAVFESGFRQFLTKLMIEFEIKVPAFDAIKYVQNTSKNVDYKKFDEMLRFVMDCDKKQSDEIEKYLQQLYQQKKIFFGIHKSDKAVMTCLVKDLKNSKHVHFIDGDQGGYALAAKNLKKQITDSEINQIS